MPTTLENPSQTSTCLPCKPLFGWPSVALAGVLGLIPALASDTSGKAEAGLPVADPPAGPSADSAPRRVRVPPTRRRVPKDPEERIEPSPTPDYAGKRPPAEAIRPYANLRGADLSGMHLCHRNLAGIILESANLKNTDFSGSDLTRANLDAKFIPEKIMVGSWGDLFLMARKREDFRLITRTGVCSETAGGHGPIQMMAAGPGKQSWLLHHQVLDWLPDDFAHLPAGKKARRELELELKGSGWGGAIGWYMSWGAWKETDWMDIVTQEVDPDGATLMADTTREAVRLDRPARQFLKTAFPVSPRQ